MRWMIPPVIKVYEALGAVVDGRVELLDGGDVDAKAWSFLRNKFYVVK